METWMLWSIASAVVAGAGVAALGLPIMALIATAVLAKSGLYAPAAAALVVAMVSAKR